MARDGPVITWHERSTVETAAVRWACAALCRVVVQDDFLWPKGGKGGRTGLALISVFVGRHVGF